MATSSDGFVTVTADSTWVSVKVVVDWGVSSPLPWQTTVKRTNPDGTVVTVRSGDLAFSPGGDVYVYDHEAPLEGVLSYQAFGYDYRGALVKTSTSTTLILPAASKTAWLKSLTNPSLSRKVSLTDYTESWVAPAVEFNVPGSRYPIVWQDVQKGIAGSITIKVKSQAAYLDVVRLVGSGTLLLQGSLVDYAFSGDVFCAAKAAQPARPKAMPGFGFRLITVPLTEVARPATAGSVLKVPNWTNDYVATHYATFTAWDAAFSSYVNQAKGP